MADGSEKSQPRTPVYTTVGITIDARNALVKFCDSRHGMNLREVISTLVERFVVLPEAGKTALVGNVDEGLEEAYAKLLEHLAEDVRRPKSRRPIVGYVSKGGKVERVD